MISEITRNNVKIEFGKKYLLASNSGLTPTTFF